MKKKLLAFPMRAEYDDFFSVENCLDGKLLNGSTYHLWAGGREGGCIGELGVLRFPGGNFTGMLKRYTEYILGICYEYGVVYSGLLGVM